MSTPESMTDPFPQISQTSSVALGSATQFPPNLTPSAGKERFTLFHLFHLPVRKRVLRKGHRLCADWVGIDYSLLFLLNSLSLSLSIYIYKNCTKHFSTAAISMATCLCSTAQPVEPPFPLLQRPSRSVGAPGRPTVGPQATR